MCCFIIGTRFLLKVKTIVRFNLGKEMSKTDYIKVETYLKNISYLFLVLCVSYDMFNFGTFLKTTLLLKVHLQGLQFQNKVLQKSHSIQ